MVSFASSHHSMAISCGHSYSSDVPTDGPVFRRNHLIMFQCGRKCKLNESESLSYICNFSDSLINKRSTTGKVVGVSLMKFFREVLSFFLIVQHVGQMQVTCFQSMQVSSSQPPRYYSIYI